MKPGERFGRWTILSLVERRKGYSYWLCRCDCGTEKSIASPSLYSGRSTSCGCRRLEVATIHGLSETVEYHTWERMLSRCYNPENTKYDLYGRRGIIVCARWKDSFVNFLQDIGAKPSPELSLGRKNNDGNYEPGNCRWETAEEQNNNKRTSRTLTFKGETKTIAQWAKATGIGRTTIAYRVKNGRSVAAALGV